jgi:putative Holliday junction resolvase
VTRGVIAIDWGARRSGFAVTDALRIAVHALNGVALDGTGPELVEHVAKLVDERDVDTLLVGLPHHAGGSKQGVEGGRAADVRAFAERLKARLPSLAIVFHDERLSTREAEDRLREAGHHGKARKARTDSWSAVVILEDWIGAGEPR